MRQITKPGLLVSVMILMILPNKGIGQEDHWQSLMSVQFEKKFDPNMGFEVEQPIFGFVQKALENQEITLNGFIIPIKGKIKQSHFMFSAFPVNMCFFCGQAGPESVIEVFMKDNQKVVYTEDRIRIKGTLMLNPGDPSGMFYKLKDGEILNI